MCWRARRRWCWARRRRCWRPATAPASRPAAGEAHHLVNRSAQDVLFLEVGDRSLGDSVIYPDDDLAGAATPEGNWRYTRKDGTPLG